MIELLRNLHEDQSGQDLIEYALLAMLISVSAVAILPVVASDVSQEFSKVTIQLS